MNRSVCGIPCGVVAPVLLGVLLLLAGCDSSSSPDPVPSATFTASVSGDTTVSMSGDAQMTTAQEAGMFIGGALPLMGPVGDDSATQLPEGTIIVLTTPEVTTGAALPGGQSILFFLPGQELSGGEYSLANPILTGLTGGFSDPSQLPPLATYLDIEGTLIRTAPGTSGSVTVDRVTAEGVFGSFTFQTLRAIAFDIAEPPTEPVDDLSDLNTVPFATTIEGRFEAARLDPSERPPMLPAAVR